MRILYIDIDSLRPDHLGCYGYHRRTSPAIDRIAAEGIRFSNYYVSDAPCLPSRTALMTGMFGIHNGVVNHGGTAADLRIEGPGRGFHSRLLDHSLPGFLNRQAGMHTCYIGGFGARHTTWSFYAGFREIHDTGKGGMESADDVTPTVLDWLDRNRSKEDWFLHVNYWDPHTPYRAPQAFGNPFADDPLPAWLDEDVVARHVTLPGPHSLRDLNMYDDNAPPAFPRQPGKVENLDEMRQLIDGYDCGVAYADRHVDRLIGELEKRGLLEDTMIVITADHGENFGELGVYCEHATADQACCRIPMIVRMPGAAGAGHVDHGLHYHLDLGPTLAEILGHDPRPEWDGRSYAASLTDGADTGRKSVVMGQCAHGCQRAVRWDHWIYIKTWHDGYHCWDEEMLFDLQHDPHEQHNLADSHPTELEAGRSAYRAWHADAMKRMPPGYSEDPLEIALNELPLHCRTDVEAYCRRLRATGRGHWVERVRQTATAFPPASG